MRQALAGQRRLIVVDNIEHLLPAAADVVADLVSVAGPVWLITSRQPIAVPGERVHPVGPVDLADARVLFADVARRRNPSWQESPESVQLCERLDGLPLAIELAAARSRVLSPRQMLDRIGQRLDLLKGGSSADPRQATLRSTIEWSYQLLTPEEQLAFARLSVFAGGFTLELAEEVADVDLDVVESLFDKSLITRSGDESADPRFTMLESVRTFAAERLEVVADDPTQRRLVGYFVDVVQRHRALNQMMLASRLLFAEFENVMNALDIAMTHAWGDDAATIASHINYLAVVGGLSLADARRILLEIGRLSGLSERSRVLVLRALMANAGQADRVDDLITLSGEAVAASRLLNDPLELAKTLGSAGHFLCLRGELELGLGYAAESVQVSGADEIEGADVRAHATTFAMWLARAGRNDEARVILAEWVDQVAGAMDCVVVANIYAEVGDAESTIDVLRRSLSEADDQGWVGVPMYAVWVLLLYGWAAEQLDEPLAAAGALACAEESPFLAQFPLDDVEQARIAVAWERIRQTVDADDLAAVIAAAQTRDPLELARELISAHASRL
jgi:predicted ATPase